MLKYQHKNFGKKLRHRAGLAIRRPKPDYDKILRDLVNKMMKNLADDILSVQPMQWPSTSVIDVFFKPQRAVEYITLNVIVKHVKNVEIPFNQVFGEHKGVSPMTGPAGLISEIRKKYDK